MDIIISLLISLFIPGIVIFSLNYFENKRLVKIYEQNRYYQENNIPLYIDSYD